MMISVKNIDHIRPLLKWRVLSLEDLSKENIYGFSKDTIRKVVRRLEKIGLLKCFYNPVNRTKSAYLTTEGRRLFGQDTKIIEEETLFHDASVSRICRELNTLPQIYDIKLEHELAGKYASRDEMVPDAQILTNTPAQVRVFLELELSQKSKSRIKTKIYKYLNDPSVGYVFYFFSLENILENYRSYVREIVTIEEFRRLGFFWVPAVLNQKEDISKIDGYLGEERKAIRDVISGICPNCPNGEIDKEISSENC